MLRQFRLLTVETLSLLTRVESRKVGYTAFKQAKKQASAIKNALKFGLREIGSVLTTGKHADHKTKLDELNETVDDLLSRHEALMTVCTSRAEVALDLQASLMEQSESYIARMKSCMEYNRQLSEGKKVLSNRVYEYLSDVDNTIISLQNMTEFLQATLDLAKYKQLKPTSGAGYVPWAMRAEAESGKTPEEIAADARAKEKAARTSRMDKEDLEEALHRIKKLQHIRHDCAVAVKHWMKERSSIEDKLATLAEAARVLNKMKSRLKSFGDDTVCAVEFRSYDHSGCSDCTIVPGIARLTAEQSLAANMKANMMTEQLNNLLMNGEQLRMAKDEIRSFNQSGDHPKSYQGGVGQEAVHTGVTSPGMRKQSSFDDSRGLAADKI